MKFSKKMMSLALATVLACAMAVPAFAATGNDTTPETDGSTELTATVPSTYVLTIPAKQEITYGALTSNFAGDAKLSVTGNVSKGKTVTVTVGGDTAMASQTQKTTIPFILTEKGKNESEKFTSAVWSDADLRAATPKAFDLAIHVTKESWDAAEAGAYSATITFTANLV